MVQCNTTVEGSASEFKLFAISEIQSTRGHHPVQWFHLFPRKLADNGWWFYKGKNMDRSSTGKLLIHSSDKEKKDIEGFHIHDLQCWAKLQALISSSEKYEKIEVDGTLEIVA